MQFKFLFFALLITSTTLHAQWDPTKKCYIDGGTNDCLSNTILTALPFLRISPDARSGAMGDAGVSLTADPAAMHHNAARLAFAEEDLGLSITYSPWLRNLGIDDIFLLYLSGFKKLDDNQALGLALRYFSLGTIEFTDANGNDQGTGRPNEFEINLGYSRKLSPVLSASLSAKFVYSNLATGQFVGTSQISAARSFGADLGLFYRNKLGQSGRRNYLNAGLAITNVGSKVTYVKGVVKDFIPTNLAIGATYEMNFDDFNSLSITGEINKLLVPTPIQPSDSAYDANHNSYADYREKPLFEGILGSFNDAPGGFTEELQELMYNVALEYWYDKQFAVRAGYFHENSLKGDRKYLTLGLGLKYNIFGMNLSYLVPTTNNRSPLANTLRFTLFFDFTNRNKNKSTPAEN
ncbi:MAG TPA: type IX secretion system outer membrane channel protein PorV [Saprospiraceae bacterium]|nr:type IX secretion system outer membrane channel protein PorV [Saprospiraceae bacterium]